MTGQFEPAVTSLRNLYDCRMIVLIIIVGIVIVVIYAWQSNDHVFDDSHLHLFNTAGWIRAGQK